MAILAVVQDHGDHVAHAKRLGHLAEGQQQFRIKLRRFAGRRLRKHAAVVREAAVDRIERQGAALPFQAMLAVHDAQHGILRVLRHLRERFHRGARNNQAHGFGV